MKTNDVYRALMLKPNYTLAALKYLMNTCSYIFKIYFICIIFEYYKVTQHTDNRMMHLSAVIKQIGR